MADDLAKKLDATKLSDNASASDDWKKGLNVPTKDTREQTEVLADSWALLVSRANSMDRMLLPQKASTLRTSSSTDSC